MAGGGLPVPRNPAALAPGGPAASHIAPPLRLDARGRALGAGPSQAWAQVWARLWALFPLAFGVAILAGVWDAAPRARPAPPAAPASPAAVRQAAPAPPARPTPPPATASHPAEDALRRFYALLSEGDRAGAYALLSGAVRREYPRTRFDESWRGVRRVRLVSATPQADGGAPGGVRLRACVEVLSPAAGQNGPSGGGPSGGGPSGAGDERALYAGPVTLVLEGGAYRVGPSAMRRVATC